MKKKARRNILNRPLSGEVAEVSRECVLAEIGGKFKSAFFRQRQLQQRWRIRAKGMARQPFCTDTKWLTAACHCTPWSVAATRPTARFCRISWACPFCYGREVAELWKRVSVGGFSLQVETRTPTLISADLAWEELLRCRRKLVDRAAGAVCWQALLPRGDVLEMRLITLTTGGYAQRDDFVTAFAYPAGWLFGDIRHAACCFWYMRHKRGRAIYGKFRGTSCSSTEL